VTPQELKLAPVFRRLQPPIANELASEMPPKTPVDKSETVLLQAQLRPVALDEWQFHLQDVAASRQHEFRVAGDVGIVLPVF